MSNLRITLAQVAEKAGVGLPTVSKVLNDRPNCWASAATRLRIQNAARELGYRPNLSAQSLRSGQSRVLGFVSPGFQAVAANSRPVGFSAAAEAADYTVVLSSHANDSESEDRVIHRLLDRAVDGLAISPVDNGPHLELKRLVKQGFPVVTFDGASLLSFECDDISSPMSDVGRVQARHLLDIGRRRICIAKALPEARINTLRDDAIRREAAAAGAPEPLILSFHRPPTGEITDPEESYPLILEFVRNHIGAFDAVTAYDALASLIIRALLACGLRVPEDVAVIGAGDGPIAGYGVVPLTSVSTQNDWAGARAFELLQDRIHGRTEHAFRRLVITPKLAIRHSTVGK